MLRLFNGINAIFTIITIVMHLDDLLTSGQTNGIYLQLYLGIYQIAFGFILLFFITKFNSLQKKFLIYYWLLVFSFTVLLFLLCIAPGITAATFIIIVFPMCIACYQVYAFHKISIINKP